MEPVQVKTFIPELPIEAFNETVLHGFSGIDKHMLYMHLIGPCIESITGKFGAIVRKNFFWTAAKQHSFIQISCYMLSGNGCIHFQCNTFPRNFIDQGEYAEPSAGNGNITDKVHGPAVIRTQKMTSIRRSAFCIDFPLQLALECKTCLFIEAVDLFVINMDAFSLQHHMDTAVSKPFPARCYRLHGLRNLFLFGIVPGLVTLRAARYPYQPASSAFADVKVLLDSFTCGTLPKILIVLFGIIVYLITDSLNGNTLIYGYITISWFAALFFITEFFYFTKGVDSAPVFSNENIGTSINGFLITFGLFILNMILKNLKIEVKDYGYIVGFLIIYFVSQLIEYEIYGFFFYGVSLTIWNVLLYRETIMNVIDNLKVRLGKMAKG